jgi:hypothetical protein
MRGLVADEKKGPLPAGGAGLVSTSACASLLELLHQKENRAPILADQVSNCRVGCMNDASGK